MNSLFVILLPSLICLKLISKLLEEKDNKILVFYYLMLLFFSNLICFAIIVIFNKFDGNLIIYIEEHLKFALKYSILSIIVNIGLSFILSICSKYLNIKLEVNYENNKKNK